MTAKMSAKIPVFEGVPDSYAIFTKGVMAYYTYEGRECLGTVLASDDGKVYAFARKLTFQVTPVEKLSSFQKSQLLGAASRGFKTIFVSAKKEVQLLAV